ncbi:MAG: hypothetical protein ACPLYD_14820, partial [Anaerolineae bacterium]
MPGPFSVRLPPPPGCDKIRPAGPWRGASLHPRRAFAAQAASATETLPRQALIRAAGLEREAGEAALSTLLVHDLLVEEGDRLRPAIPLLYTWIKTQSGKPRRHEDTKSIFNIS